MPDFTEGIIATKDQEIQRLSAENSRLSNEKADLSAQNNRMRVELADLQTRIAQIGNMTR